MLQPLAARGDPGVEADRLAFRQADDLIGRQRLILHEDVGGAQLVLRHRAHGALHDAEPGDARAEGRSPLQQCPPGEVGGLVLAGIENTGYATGHAPILSDTAAATETEPILRRAVNACQRPSFAAALPGGEHAWE